MCQSLRGCVTIRGTTVGPQPTWPPSNPPCSTVQRPLKTLFGISKTIDPAAKQEGDNADRTASVLETGSSQCVKSTAAWLRQREPPTPLNIDDQILDNGDVERRLVSRLREDQAPPAIERRGEACTALRRPGTKFDAATAVAVKVSQAR